MRKFLQTGLTWFHAFGFEPVKTVSAIRNFPVSLKEHFELRRQNARLQDRWRIVLTAPNFTDRTEPGGIASGHYFHQDLLVAKRIFERKPERHVDIGSRIDGFVAHVAVFREIEVFDIRPLPVQVRNIRFRKLDVMDPKEELMDYCDSISCLHALEHFGLGRYGDPLDAGGYENGFKQMARMLRTGGIFYLSMPIGEERIEFNGQRVFSLRRAFKLFDNHFSLTAFSYIDDAVDLHEDVRLSAADIEGGLDLVNGCGIFELQKLEPSTSEAIGR